MKVGVDDLVGAAALVDSQPLPVWLDYLRLRVIDQHADHLPRAFAASFATIHGPANPHAAPWYHELAMQYMRDHPGTQYAAAVAHVSGRG